MAYITCGKWILIFEDTYTCLIINNDITTMRKLMILMVVVVSAITASAQRASDADLSWYGDDDINHSGIFADLSAGCLTTNTDFAASLKLGYRWNFNESFSWDVISIGAGTGVSAFTDYLALRFLTGIRYNTPEELIGKSLYFNVGLGYSRMVDDTEMEGGAFAYEIGGGVALSRLISLGIVWEGSSGFADGTDSKNSMIWGLIGVKLGINF